MGGGDMVQLSQSRRGAGGRTSATAGQRDCSIGALLLAGIEAIVIARWWTGTGYVPRAVRPHRSLGELTAVGLPIAQFVHEMAGVAVVGLLFAAVFSARARMRPRRSAT